MQYGLLCVVFETQCCCFCLVHTPWWHQRAMKIPHSLSSSSSIGPGAKKFQKIGDLVILCGFIQKFLSSVVCVPWRYLGVMSANRVVLKIIRVFQWLIDISWFRYFKWHFPDLFHFSASRRDIKEDLPEARPWYDWQSQTVFAQVHHSPVGHQWGFQGPVMAPYKQYGRGSPL